MSSKEDEGEKSEETYERREEGRRRDQRMSAATKSYIREKALKKGDFISKKSKHGTHLERQPAAGLVEVVGRSHTHPQQQLQRQQHQHQHQQNQKDL